MAPSGMLAEVTQERVKALLLRREPDLLDSTDSGQVSLFEDRVKGSAVQVELLTGSNPPQGVVRRLAVEAIAVETASQVEYAEYPEQQSAGDEGRGYHLHQRFLELLAQLQQIVDSNGGQVPGGEDPLPSAGGPPSPTGWYPPAEPYPDPAIASSRRWCW